MPTDDEKKEVLELWKDHLDKVAKFRVTMLKSRPAATEEYMLLDDKTVPERDHHRVRAAEMFGVPYEEVTPDQRKAAKDLYLIDYLSVTPEHLVEVLAKLP